MKHLKYFKVNENLSDDKIDKIKALNNPGFYENVEVELIKEEECLIEFNTLNSHISKIKKLFKDAHFRKVKNIHDMDVLKVSPLPDEYDFKFSIIEADDEYFVVYVYNDNTPGPSYAKFLCDQIDGLMSLLNDLHKIIYS
jgi:hypothetical protein